MNQIKYDDYLLAKMDEEFRYSSIGGIDNQPLPKAMILDMLRGGWSFNAVYDVAYDVKHGESLEWALSEHCPNGSNSIPTSRVWFTE